MNPTVFSIRYKPPWTDANNLEDLGDALEKELKTKIAEGHVLYDRDITMLAQRKDKNELALQLDDHSIALVQYDKTRKEEREQLRVIKIFRNEEDFWRLKLRNDILGIKD